MTEFNLSITGNVLRNRHPSLIFLVKLIRAMITFDYSSELVFLMFLIKRVELVRIVFHTSLYLTLQEDRRRLHHGIV